jgi:hypothetical protein
MLIPTHIAFALRCSRCGRLETHGVWRFAFGGGRTVTLHCSCGHPLLTLTPKRGEIRIQFPCFLCDGTHHQVYPARRFWSRALKQLHCLDTELQLGVFGPEADVDLYVRTGGSELDRLMADAAFGEFFDHPQVMFRALSHVHGLAAAGNLVCRCGNRQIAVNVYPEALELTCAACRRSKRLPAGREEDLQALEALLRIELGDDAPGRRRGGHS